MRRVFACDPVPGYTGYESRSHRAPMGPQAAAFLDPGWAQSAQETDGESDMRVVVIIKATPNSGAGVMPSTELLTAMGQYNEPLANAGVLLSGEGLQPSARSRRVAISAGPPASPMGRSIRCRSSSPAFGSGGCAPCMKPSSGPNAAGPDAGRGEALGDLSALRYG